MKNFFKEYRLFWSVVAAALIIGAFIYLLGENKANTPANANQAPAAVENPPNETNKNCVDYTKAIDYVGEYGCVSGRVVSVYTSSKGTIFLDFCQNYKTCPFSAVVFNSDAYKFSNPKIYEGKIVELNGLIKTYQGRPEIILNDPGQIKIR